MAIREAKNEKLREAQMFNIPDELLADVFHNLEQK